MKKTSIKTGKERSGQHKGTIFVETSGPTIRTLDQLLKVCDPDLAKYEVHDHVVQSWNTPMKVGKDKKPIIVTNFQVKAWFKLKRPLDTLASLAQQLIEDIKRQAHKTIKPPKPRPVSDQGVLLEIGIFDLHLGSLAWKEESGENYDLSLAKKVFVDAVIDLINKAKVFKIKRIVYPIGNDFFHADNADNTTTAGTRLHLDTRYHKMFREGCNLQRWAIEQLRQIAPVDVVVIPGNHDQNSSFALGLYLEGIYERHEDVQILNSASLRKYYVFGQTLIGYTHGKHEPLPQLPLLMATEAKAEWAKTRFREFHVGHTHHRRHTQHPPRYVDHNGVLVRTLPSLAATDSYHHQHAYVGAVKAAEAYVYDEQQGLIATLHTQRDDIVD